MTDKLAEASRHPLIVSLLSVFAATLIAAAGSWMSKIDAKANLLDDRVRNLEIRVSSDVSDIKAKLDQLIARSR